MIHFFYEIAMWLAALFFVPYHLYRSVQRKRPAAFAERFGVIAGRDLAALEGKRPIWVHAVSVGEVLAVSALVKELRRSFPQYRVAVSTTTATGQKLAKQHFGEDSVFYFPLDFRFAMRPYFAALQPRLIVLAETEFWPNFLRAAHASAYHIHAS